MVDQLEAVFTLTTSEEERQKFFELLVTAVTEPSGPLCLLLTLRIDFYPQVVRYDKLYQLIDKHHISVLPLTERDDLRKVIEQPANLPKVQLTFERGLVDELLLDMQRQSGALPLLEFTLDQLYQRRDRPDSFLLTWQAYHEMGDIKGALERHADRTFDELPSDEHRQMVHDMFLRLIRPGTTEQEDTIRRRVPLEEFEQADPVQMQKMRETLEAFTSARLLTKDQIDGITTIAVSHETLIREWKRLAGWVRESRDDILFQQSLSEDVAEWERHGKPRDRLYPRSKLKEAQAWARRNTPNSNEETFLHASAKRRMQFIVSIVGIVLLLLSTAGIAVWLSLHQQPDPTLVTTLQDGGIGSLRWAIDTAPSGSTITFDQHLWNQITTLTADLVIAKKRLSIRGPDTGRITINNSTYQVHVGVGASISIFSLAFTNDKSNPPCILLNDGVLTLTNSTVSGNTVSGCTVPSGGSIYNNGGKLALINSMVSVNTASSGSGGIVNDGGTLILTNSIVSNNAGSGSFGGGIENSGGTLMLTNSTISGNTNSGGGGIANFNGDVMLIKSTVSNNTASSGSGGGGIENVRLGMLTLTNSIVSGNMAAGDGGGIANDTGTLMLTNSSVSNNTASDGGGIRNFGDTRLINSTVSDNTASRTGGGIFDNGGNVEIAFCTLYGNAAIKGGGLFAQDIPDYQQSASLVARNSLIAGNHASIDSDVAGNFISEGYNLIQIASDITLQRSDLSGNPNIDPKLQQNGGPTQTHALLRGSPAIDAIPLAACHITVNGIIITTDQRGIKRPQGSACDIGAYEYVP